MRFIACASLASAAMQVPKDAMQQAATDPFMSELAMAIDPDGSIKTLREGSSSDTEPADMFAGLALPGATVIEPKSGLAATASKKSKYSGFSQTGTRLLDARDGIEDTIDFAIGVIPTIDDDYPYQCVCMSQEDHEKRVLATAAAAIPCAANTNCVEPLICDMTRVYATPECASGNGYMQNGVKCGTCSVPVGWKGFDVKATPVAAKDKDKEKKVESSEDNPTGDYPGYKPGRTGFCLRDPTEKCFPIPII